MTKTKATLLLGAALTLGSASLAEAGTLSPTLLQRAQRGDQTPTGVIVRFKFSNTDRGRALFKSSRQQLQARLAQLGPAAGFINQAVNSGRVTQLWLDQSIFLPLTPVQARALAALPFVDAVFENFAQSFARQLDFDDRIVKGQHRKHVAFR